MDMGKDGPGRSFLRAVVGRTTDAVLRVEVKHDVDYMDRYVIACERAALRCMA